MSTTLRIPPRQIQVIDIRPCPRNLLGRDIDMYGSCTEFLRATGFTFFRELFWLEVRLD
jgi:hypothetical protein